MSDLIERLLASDAASALTNEAAREIAKLRDAIEALIDDEPCHKDHHGYCQSHGLNDPCEVAVARELLGK